MLAFFKLFVKKKMEKMFQQSLLKLEEFMKEVKLPAA
jgi:hypothetical protein